ncbi:MAG: hypothetical protein JJT82_09750 [Legionellaceae bacterium]|nr:hypothetical protein [Legionellaceae bacterium]
MMREEEVLDSQLLILLSRDNITEDSCQPGIPAFSMKHAMRHVNSGMYQERTALVVIDSAGNMVDLATHPEFELLGDNQKHSAQLRSILANNRAKLVPLENIAGRCNKSFIVGITGCETTQELAQRVRELHDEYLAPDSHIRVQICNFSEKDVCNSIGESVRQGTFKDFITPENCTISIPRHYSIITDKTTSAIDLDLVNYDDFSKVKLSLSRIASQSTTPEIMARWVDKVITEQLPDILIERITIVTQESEVDVDLTQQHTPQPDV